MEASPMEGLASLVVDTTGCVGRGGGGSLPASPLLGAHMSTLSLRTISIM